MPIIPSGFAQVNLRFSGLAVPFGAEITLGLDIGAIVAPDPVVVANAVADEWSPSVMGQLSNQITFIECYCKFGPNDTGPSGSAFRTVNGSVSAEPVTPNTAALVRKTTSSGGRRGRGRFYLPGIKEGDINGSGQLSTAYLNALQVQMDVFRTGLTGIDLEPVVLHAAGISSTPAPTPILGLDVQQLCGTQRDRMRR